MPLGKSALRTRIARRYQRRNPFHGADLEQMIELCLEARIEPGLTDPHRHRQHRVAQLESIERNDIEVHVGPGIDQDQIHAHSRRCADDPLHILRVLHVVRGISVRGIYVEGSNVGRRQSQSFRIQIDVALVDSVGPQNGYALFLCTDGRPHIACCVHRPEIENSRKVPPGVMK